LFLSGAVLWCVGVPLVPLTHAVLGWCHGHTPEPDPCASNTWPGVGQGPCMQHTCVHSAIRMGTHASVSLAGCHDSRVTTRTQQARVRTRTRAPTHT
jgi:hypothetical protein